MFVETLIAALALGAIFGFAVCTVLVADPLRRSRNLLRDRVISEQMRTYAADSRLAAHKMLHQAEARELDSFSRKVTDLTVVK